MPTQDAIIKFLKGGGLYRLQQNFTNTLCCLKVDITHVSHMFEHKK